MYEFDYCEDCNEISYSIHVNNNGIERKNLSSYHHKCKNVHKIKEDSMKLDKMLNKLTTRRILTDEECKMFADELKKVYNKNTDV